MNSLHQPKTSKTIAKLCIWTIRNHNFLISQLRIYMWSATATILFLSIAQRIDIKAALTAIFFGALFIFILLWGLLAIRRKCLLNIVDPELKRQAYAAMLEFIEARKDPIGSQNNFWHRFWHYFNA